MDFGILWDSNEHLKVSGGGGTDQVVKYVRYFGIRFMSLQVSNLALYGRQTAVRKSMVFVQDLTCSSQSVCPKNFYREL
jgi:hypothetical protein